MTDQEVNTQSGSPSSPTTEAGREHAEWCEQLSEALQRITSIAQANWQPMDGDYETFYGELAKAHEVAGLAGDASESPPTCTFGGCGLPDRLHGAPDDSRVTHSDHWFCDSTKTHAYHRHGPGDASESGRPPERPNGKPPRRFPCPDCKEWFWYRADLSKHRNAIHPVGDASESGQPPDGGS